MYRSICPIKWSREFIIIAACFPTQNILIFRNWSANKVKWLSPGSRKPAHHWIVTTSVRCLGCPKPLFVFWKKALNRLCRLVTETKSLWKICHCTGPWPHLIYIPKGLRLYKKSQFILCWIHFNILPNYFIRHNKWKEKNTKK